MYVGKVTVPKGIALFLAKKYLPSSAKILNDGSIDIDSIEYECRGR